MLLNLRTLVNADKSNLVIPHPDVGDLIFLFRCVLENDYFEFDGKYCNQIIRCNMDAIPSPEIMDIWECTNLLDTKNLNFSIQNTISRKILRWWIYHFWWTKKGNPWVFVIFISSYHILFHTNYFHKNSAQNVPQRRMYQAVEKHKRSINPQNNSTGLQKTVIKERLFWEGNKSDHWRYLRKRKETLNG